MVITWDITGLAVASWDRVTFGFAAWGLWHGLELFVYSQFPTLHKRFGLPTILGTACTFLCVTSGWIFFVNGLTSGLRLFRDLFAFGAT